MFVMIAVFLFIGIIKSFCTDDDRLCAAYVVRTFDLIALVAPTQPLTITARVSLWLPPQLTEYVVRSLIMLGIIVAMNFNITVRPLPSHQLPHHLVANDNRCTVVD